MKLIVAHQILIGSAIALALLFGARALVLATRGDGAMNGAIGAASLLVALALTLYFRKLRARYLTERVSDRRDGSVSDRRDGSAPRSVNGGR